LLITCFSDTFTLHGDPVNPHPESPERVLVAFSIVKEVIPKEELRVVEPSTPSRRIVELIHDKSYVEYIERESRKGPHYIDADTYVNEYTFEVALLAAGAAWNAADISLEEHVPVLALIRPPGHHAGRSGPALGALSNGFCIFNNAAMATRNFLDRGLKVMVLDFDAHHGNGTQEIFWHESRVLHVDIHEYGIYPGTGNVNDVGGKGAEGTKINIPLPHNAGDKEFMWVIHEVLPRLARAFKPEALVVSAGFDSHVLDFMSTLRASDEIFAALGSFVAELVRHHVDGAVIVLEGGYGNALPAGLRSFLRGLLFRAMVREHVPIPAESTWVRGVVSVLRKYWGTEIFSD